MNPLGVSQQQTLQKEKENGKEYSAEDTRVTLTYSIKAYRASQSPI